MPPAPRRGETELVGYEVYLLAVPPGADVEETGEALLVRLARGHERTRLTDAGRARAEGVAARMTAKAPDLAVAAPGTLDLAGTVELRSASGLVVAIADRFARFLVPFAHHGEAATAAFRQLFDLLAVAAEATGWRPDDPQEGESIVLDEASCDAVLEIYLSVMDQLRPAPFADGTAGAVPA